MLHITLFGSFQVMLETNPEVKLTGTTKKLFAYLLLQNYRPQPRELLADLFWGDQGEERAHKCLNTTLWRLRTSLEKQGIQEAGSLITTHLDKVSFNRESQHQLDLAIFEEKARSLLNRPVEAMSTADETEFQTMQQIYRGELLEGFYDDWALRAREHMRKVYLDCLALYMHYDQQAGRSLTALEKGQQILELDPLREEIHREVMRLYLATGQRAQAIRQFQNCAALLERELAISPMPETQRLYESCLEGSSIPVTAAKKAQPAIDLRSRSTPISQTELDAIYQELENLSSTLTQAREQLQQVKHQLVKHKEKNSTQPQA